MPCHRWLGCIISGAVLRGRTLDAQRHLQTVRFCGKDLDFGLTQIVPHARISRMKWIVRDASSKHQHETQFCTMGLKNLQIGFFEMWYFFQRCSDNLWAHLVRLVMLIPLCYGMKGYIFTRQDSGNRSGSSNANVGQQNVCLNTRHLFATSPFWPQTVVAAFHVQKFQR